MNFLPISIISLSIIRICITFKTFLNCYDKREKRSTIFNPRKKEIIIDHKTLKFNEIWKRFEQDTSRRESTCKTNQRKALFALVKAVAAGSRDVKF